MLQGRRHRWNPVGRRRQGPHRRSLRAATTTSSRVSAAATTPGIRSSSANASWRCASFPRARMHPQRRDLFVGGGTVISLGTLLARTRRAGGDRRRRRPREDLGSRARRACRITSTPTGPRERARGGNAIGTTGRGIGPAYVDRVARTGIRFGDLLHGAARWPEKLWRQGGAPPIEVIVARRSTRRAASRRTSSTASPTSTIASARGKRVL